MTELQARPLVDVLREEARAEMIAEWAKEFDMSEADVARSFADDLEDKVEARVKERLEVSMRAMGVEPGFGKERKQPHEDRPLAARVAGVRSIDALHLPLRFTATWRALDAMARRDPRRIAATTLGNLAERAGALAHVKVSVSAAHVAVRYFGEVGLIEIIVDPVPAWESRPRTDGRFLTVKGEYMVPTIRALPYKEIKARIAATPPPVMPDTARQRRHRAARLATRA
jgi:hypothetical protein